MKEEARLTFRLLDDKIREPYRHFALEEALIRQIDEGNSAPTIRLRTVIPSVFVGVYQYPEEDVDIEFCRNRGIPIVRRPNPGGAVYQDEGSFCYSLFFMKELCFNHWGIKEPGELYGLVGEAVKDVCREYGVEAEISPVNDVTIDRRKVYGSAQVQCYSSFAHSGTFLVNTDIETMQKALKPSKLKFADKGFFNIRERVINLSEAAKRDISTEEVKYRLAKHLANRLKLKLEPGELTQTETECAEELYKTKYSKPEWTHRSNSAYTHVVSIKAKSGVIGLSVELEGEKVNEISIKGDFLIPDPGKLAEVIKEIRGKRIGEVSAIIGAGELPEDIEEAMEKLVKEIEESINERR